MKVIHINVTQNRREGGLRISTNIQFADIKIHLFQYLSFSRQTSTPSTGALGKGNFTLCDNMVQPVREKV